MNTTGIVILVAVVVILLVIAALTTGYYLNKRRRVSLKDEPIVPKSLDKSGGYKAGGGFNFSEGPGAKVPEPVTPDKPKSAPKAEAAAAAGLAESPAEAATEESEARVEAEESVGEDLAPEVEPAPGGDTLVAKPDGATAPAAPGSAAAPSGSDLAALAETPAEEAKEDEQAQLDAEAAAGAQLEPDVEIAPGGDTVEPKGGAVTVETEPEPARPALDEIEPTAGRLDRLKGRLARSQSTVGVSLLGLLGAGDLDDESWEEIEDTLLLADLGTPTTLKVTESLRDEIAANGVADATQARALLRKVLIAELRPELDRSIRALPHAGAPSVLLVVGVNGTGKTTTTGKLARVLVADGRRVLLGAADTFRAAAADQLQTWAERVGAEVVRGKEAADPAAVAFDAVARGTEQGVDVVLIDTAGRLHTKTGLMDELGKVKRVVEKKARVDEVLLVLDATIGQNGLTQAKVFAEVVDITGVVLTKLDGTAKGGIVYAVQHELGVPVKLVGLGEGADDLAPFEPAAFVDALLG
ncbi:signal recognition particle-docking protein FtsY [Tsukamurella soli]|uniref:Signal recognition particle receptor FtsY n=1 Tax=Tsukamurella soli TaxID=644556 RepID=A0ABP8K589_9ACTN